jgi:hypothetical protein
LIKHRTITHKEYDFAERASLGAMHAAKIDAAFARDFNIVPASKRDDRTGIDRWYYPRVAECLKFSVQYKADDQWDETGNVAIEIVSVIETQTPGWAASCPADVLMYYATKTSRLISLDMMSIKRWLPTALMAGYKLRDTSSTKGSQRWSTRNLIVPFSTMQQSGFIVWATQLSQ